MTKNLIRNFAFIAHVDHGKSTLADRFIEHCKGLSKREMSEQVLDSMDLERERGITIKAQSVSLQYKGYLLNLIDTPGHADFAYEVSRSLASCEGAVLLVDAASSVKAQTVAHCTIAVAEGLDILPVLNKVDLPAANIENCLSDIKRILRIDTSNFVTCSAKYDLNIPAVLDSIIEHIRPPIGSLDEPLKARIIDSWFDSYTGVIALVRIYDGIVKLGDRIKIVSTNTTYTIDKVGTFTPKKTYLSELSCGQVGFLSFGLKDINRAPVGDTILHANDDTSEQLPGFKVIMPKLFAGIFPNDKHEFAACQKALNKLALNDSALQFKSELSSVLGNGFRCGFLGLLHLNIVQERLKREYSLDLLITAPTVSYKVILKNQAEVWVQYPSDLPPMQDIINFLEPMLDITVSTPEAYVGEVMELCHGRFGRELQRSYNELDNSIVLEYRIPFIEVINQFSDKLKSLTKGYGNFEYSYSELEPADIGVMHILLNDIEVESLACFVRKSKARSYAMNLVTTLKKSIPRAMFGIKIQAVWGNKVVAREDISPMRKNVIAKCYGGDITRKMKLLERQKAGKKSMKSVGKVVVPNSVFLDILTAENKFKT